MNSTTKFEHRASSSRSKHEGESSSSLCDRLSRTRDSSQRQLPTDQDYAVSTREYQIDQSSLKPAPTAAGPVLDKYPKQRQQQKQPRSYAGIDRVTPYQGRSIALHGIPLRSRRSHVPHKPPVPHPSLLSNPHRRCRPAENETQPQLTQTAGYPIHPVILRERGPERFSVRGW